MRITVESPGLLTTVQDSGRFGYERFGVSPSGPVDRLSFQIANILVGNPRGESALEATLAGPSLLFDGDGVIALTGADMSASLNGVSCPVYQAVAVHSGDRLVLGSARTGCRAYLAFSGGLDVPPVMGSRSTSLQTRLGGLNGRKLLSGDVLSTRPASLPDHPETRRTGIRPAAKGVLRVILGPQDSSFAREGLEVFLSQPYTVTGDSDRMGCRLAGPVIRHIGDANILSDGMVTGAVQVPDSGQPIIMLADRQTVGGYTKIASVISADLPLIGQCRPGDTVLFRAVSLSEAHAALRRQEQALADLEAAVSRQASSFPEKNYQIRINGTAYHVTIRRIE